MILGKISKEGMRVFEICEKYALKEVSDNIFESKDRDCFFISFENDLNNEKLKLLVILSPIFIASFDSDDKRLSFLEKCMENSSYPYALYPHFFANFDRDKYLKEISDSNKIREDIVLTKDNRLIFYFNLLDESFLISLLCMVDNLILDDKNRKDLLKYFDKMRDDIVINGRRSILANGIQAFYLNKYVVVWMLELIDFIKNKNPESAPYLIAIEDLINKLKTPRNIINKS